MCHILWHQILRLKYSALLHFLHNIYALVLFVNPLIIGFCRVMNISYLTRISISNYEHKLYVMQLGRSQDFKHEVSNSEKLQEWLTVSLATAPIREGVATK